MTQQITTHRDLIVYQKSFAAGKRIFELSRNFPREEMYSLTDQVRRSSRSVSANIAEAWRKRRYEKHFCSTLNIAEAEAAETQVWIDYASAHNYLEMVTAKQATEFYDEILRLLVAMIRDSAKWCDPLRNEHVESKRVRETKGVYLPCDGGPLLDQYELLTPYLAPPDSHLPTPISPSESPEAQDA